MNIEEFSNSDLCISADLLKALHEFDRDNDVQDWGYLDGLQLCEFESYGGTILCDPALTPVNTLSFASTGGDDVHFGLLAINGKYGDTSPVVMTVPMADLNPVNANFILGHSVYEFLCLGCVHGFSILEELAYGGVDELVEMFSEPPDHEEDLVFSKFRERLKLKPWTEIPRRLEELESFYKLQLVFDSSGE